MKDYLQDMIQHTNGLGNVDLLKVTGTDKVTQVGAISDDKSVIIEGVFKNPSIDFVGVFGMPNLSKLRTILGFDEYDADAKINMLRESRDGVEYPSAIHFETKTGDFVNVYRLMSKTIIEDKVKSVQFKGAVWNVEFEPSIAGILRLKKQASANSEEKNFTAMTKDGDLKFTFGDPSTHSGNFVFQSQVGGTLSRPWMWPVKEFLSIMDLPGEKKVKISDQGVAEITVDSGLAVYRYLLPAQSK